MAAAMPPFCFVYLLLLLACLAAFLRNTRQDYVEVRCVPGGSQRWAPVPPARNPGDCQIFYGDIDTQKP